MAGLAVVAMLVILRIVAASWSNVLQKQLLKQAPSASSLLVNSWGWMTLISAVVWLPAMASSLSWLEVSPIEIESVSSEEKSSPFLSLTGFEITEPASFGFWMLLAMLLEVPGNWLLLRSLSQTDLSIYGPLNSFKPVVGLIAGIVLLSEWPSPLGLVGMCVVLIGTYGLADRFEGQPVASGKALVSHPGVRDRMLAMILTATASVFLKRAMESASQLTVLAVWSCLGWLLAMMFLGASRMVRSQQNSAQLDSIIRPGALLEKFFSKRVFLIALFVLTMQGLTIVLFHLMPVAYALALFQMGSLASVYLGHRVFGEPDVWRRLAASAIMVLGAILIVFSR